MNKGTLHSASLAFLLLALQVPASAATYSYDSAGRLTGVDYGPAGVVVYTYDAAGNLVGRHVEVAYTPTSTQTSTCSPTTTPTPRATNTPTQTQTTTPTPSLVTFDVGPPGPLPFGGTYVESGMMLTSYSNYSSIGDPLGLGHSGNALYFHGTNQYVVGQMVDASAFDLLGFDFMTNGYTNSRWVETSAGTVQYLAGLAFQHYTFTAPGFSNITWFKIGTPWYATEVDNISFSRRTATPTITSTATTTATATSSATPTATSTPTPTSTPTQIPTSTPTPTNTVTSTLTATPTGTATETPTNSPTATFTASPTSVPTTTATHTATATETPTNSPTGALTATASSTPTHTVTSTPTVAPSATLAAGCPHVPPACASAGKGSLLVKDPTDRGKSQFVWKWTKGAVAIMRGDFGDPVSGNTSYRLCLYDESSVGPVFKMGATIAPGGTCGSTACWKAWSDRGCAYKNASGNASGIIKVQLKGGDAGKPQVQVRGKGGSLPLPPPVSSTKVFNQDSAIIIVQLQRTDPTPGCWGSTFTASGTKKNDGVQFRAVTP